MSIAAHAAHLGVSLLDFVYPPHCPTCDAWQPPSEREVLCSACTLSLHETSGIRCRRCSAPMEAPTVSGLSCQSCAHWGDTNLAMALVLTDFVGVAGAAVHSLKFNGISKIGPFLGRQIAASQDLQSELASLDLLVPVPLHAARQRERGYNQAEEIARGLAHALGIPLDRGCVRRCRPTRQQARLHASERVANMVGAFTARRPAQGGPTRIGLVDDVLTTGATLSACAAALHTHTDAEIVAVAVASPFRNPVPLT